MMYSVAAAAKLLRSCPTLCDPMYSGPPDSSVPGILQARIQEWVAISFSGCTLHISYISRVTIYSLDVLLFLFGTSLLFRTQILTSFTRFGSRELFPVVRSQIHLQWTRFCHGWEIFQKTEKSRAPKLFWAVAMLFIKKSHSSSLLLGIIFFLGSWDTAQLSASLSLSDTPKLVSSFFLPCTFCSPPL